MQCKDNNDMQLKKIADKILENSQHTIYLQYRFFALTLSSMQIIQDVEINTIAVKNNSIVYNANYIVKAFKNNIEITSYLLHSLFHIIFKHTVKKLQSRHAEKWDLACDILVGNILDGQNVPFNDSVLKNKRQNIYNEINKSYSLSSAETVYNYVDNVSENNLDKLRQLFKVDSHDFWQTKSESFKDYDESEMEELVDMLSSDAKIQLEYMQNNEQYSEILKVLNNSSKNKYDYKKFLNKLLSIREIVKTDNDEFDYNFYSYGLQMFKNIAFIEQLEYSQTKNLQDIILVVDTSGSTKGDVVKRFIEQTFTIIEQYKSSSCKINLRILQCDDEVRQDYLIKDANSLKEYSSNFQILGGGGTNLYKPIEYLEKNQNKTTNKIKAMLYFTDGFGVYPKLPPPYPVAYIFLEGGVNNYKIPAWAMKLIIRSEDLI